VLCAGLIGPVRHQDEPLRVRTKPFRDRIAADARLNAQALARPRFAQPQPNVEENRRCSW
jgi:hypothetical protein